MKTKLLGWRKPAMTGGGLKLLIVPVLTILLVSGNGDAQTNYVELKAFDAANVLGDTPYGLIEGSDGGLYGTAAYGGASTQGTVFRLDKLCGAALPLHSFGSLAADGQTPLSELVESPEGILYGTTAYGGRATGLGFGTLFKLNLDGSQYAVLHRFGISAADGKYPFSRPLFSGGVLFGMTSDGGSSGNGTLFRIDADGRSYQVMRSFNGATGEAGPDGGLVKGTDGALYGMVRYAGSDNFSGAIFKINSDGLGYSVLYRLNANGLEGACPSEGIIEGTDGRLYGSTLVGGPGGDGVTFRLGKDGTGFTVLHSFSFTGNGGARPNRLVEGPDGALYGAASSGGKFSGGTVFKMNKDGSGFLVLRSFGRFIGDGLEPSKALLFAGNGALYGTAASGGMNNSGTVFALFQRPQCWFTGQTSHKNVPSSFQALGAAGVRYRLQRTRNFSLPAWMNLATNTATPSGTLSFTNLPASSAPSFYRIVTP